MKNTDAALPENDVNDTAGSNWSYLVKAAMLNLQQNKAQELVPATCWE